MPARVAELIFKGTNRSAIRAMNEIATTSDKTARKVEAGGKRASRSYDNLGRSTGRLRSSFAGLAGVIGITGLAFGIKDLVQGGEKLQIQQMNLRAALIATGQAASGQQATLEKAAEGLSTHGGFGLPENIGALALFQRETHSTSKSLNLLNLATNIARARNTDLATSQKVVARAYTGQVGRLQMLIGPMVTSTAAHYGLTQAHKSEMNALSAQSKAMGKAGPAWLKQQELIRGITPQQAALAKLQDKHATALEFLAAAQRLFGSATSTYSKTTQGRLNNLSHSAQNLRDVLGEALLPAINVLVKGLTGLVTWLNKNRVVLYVLLGAIVAVSAVLTTHAIIVETVKAKNYLLIASNRLLGTSFAVSAGETEGATVATWGFSAALDAIPIFALIAGIVLIATHFKQFKQIVSSVWTWLKHATMDVIHFIGAHWKLFAIGGALALGGPFIALPLTIALYFGKVKAIVVSVVRFIGHIFSTVWGALTWPFRKAWGFISGIFNKIKHGVQTIIGLPGKVVGSVGHFVSSLNPFAEGGVVGAPRYMARGGPSGTDTVPAWLTPGEGILTRAAMGRIGAGGLADLNAGRGGGAIHIVPGPVVLQIDGRTIARSTINYTLRRAARGPSSLVGGSLATGLAAHG